MGNHDLDAFLKKINFWRENERGRHAGAKGFRASKPDQKVDTIGGTFGLTVISENVFENLGPEPLPLKRIIDIIIILVSWYRKTETDVLF